MGQGQSILSKKLWFQWAKVPKLVFDDEFASKVQGDHGDITTKIFGILLLHRGPVLKLILDIDNLGSYSDVDQILIFLSRNGIQELTLLVTNSEDHELPPFIFSCLQLIHLSLSSCVFKPPPTFTGFGKLIRLELLEVELASVASISGCPLLEKLFLESLTIIDNFSIDAPKLKILGFKESIKYISFINTPILAALKLIGDDKDFAGDGMFDLIKLFGSVPQIINLHIYFRYLQRPKYHKLPTVLKHLRYLELYSISFPEMDELSSALCLLRSSPNLQKLRVEVVQGPLMMWNLCLNI